MQLLKNYRPPPAPRPFGDTRRAITWSKLLKGRGGVQMRTVKHHTRKGVPLEHWARAWVGVSEALAQMERNPGHDYCVLGGERNDSLEETLRTCMKRCLPRQREVPAERGPLLAEDPVSCAANRPAPQLRGGLLPGSELHSGISDSVAVGRPS